MLPSGSYAGPKVEHTKTVFYHKVLITMDAVLVVVMFATLTA